MGVLAQSSTQELWLLR